MVRPFISFTQDRAQSAEWVGEILKASGYQEPILTKGWDPTVPMRKTLEELKKADCFFALVSPVRAEDGKGADPTRPAPWIEQEMAIAVDKELPMILIWDRGVGRNAAREPPVFASVEADFDDAASLLKLTPKLVTIARKILSFYEKTVGTVLPFISEHVHFINVFESDKEWKKYRIISLTALKRTEQIDHMVTVGQDKTPGLSVKLADPDHDLKVTCKNDPGRLDVHVLKNEDSEVMYKIVFTPALNPGETIEYRHESRHPNIFPMTVDTLRKRVRMEKIPPYMKDGYVGDGLAVSRPIDKAILEVEAPLALGLASPQVRVYVSGTHTEIEDESSRLGNPDSARGLWKVIQDDARERWNCQVTIPKPQMGYTYFLLVRPTK